MDKDGKIQKNDKVENTCLSIKKYFKKIPLSANGPESSSVWYDTYRFLTDVRIQKCYTLKPYLTKAIATSKKNKTDKIDAKY